MKFDPSDFFGTVVMGATLCVIVFLMGSCAVKVGEQSTRERLDRQANDARVQLACIEKSGIWINDSKQCIIK